MKRPVQHTEARRILGRAPNSNSFWLCTNDSLRSLADVAACLEEVDDDVFRYHVTRDKNDFEVWIRDVIKDKELAREIARVKTKETLIRKINERVNALRKITKRQREVSERKRPKKTKIKKRLKKVRHSAKKASKVNVKRKTVTKKRKTLVKRKVQKRIAKHTSRKAKKVRKDKKVRLRKVAAKLRKKKAKRVIQARKAKG